MKTYVQPEESISEVNESLQHEDARDQVIQGGKFVGCAEDLRRGKFTNLLHFGTGLWESEVVWRTGVQKCI
jgi:hypothetical protein